MQALQTIPKQEVELSREKIELIKQTVAKGATDIELELFFHACKRTGLDPLMKQLYCIKRWSSQEQRETMAFQTGIDGYRLIADRTGCYAGSSDAEYVTKDGSLVMAKVSVTKLVNGVPCQFTASARWDEYVQKNKAGQPTSMWAKMPFLMLGKCAEALALRKAFPAELSGLYTHEEMQQADEVKPVLQGKITAQQKINELRQESFTEAESSGEAAISDADWDTFLDYMSEDPDRTNIGKQLKDILRIPKVADLQGGARVGFLKQFQQACSEQGIACEEWVK